MSLSMRLSCLVFALAVAGPAVAQEAPTATRLAAASHVPVGALKYCGARFLCYNGIPLRCAENTRPYQNVAKHQCFCVHDGCPQ